MKKDITVYFRHPIDGRWLSVYLEPSITAAECIDELMACDFIPQHFDGYCLRVEGGNYLSHLKTFNEEGVKNNDCIRVIPQTSAGGGGVEVPESVTGQGFWMQVNKYQFIYSLGGLMLGFSSIIGKPRSFTVKTKSSIPKERV